MTFVAVSGARGGWRAGLAAALGVTTGCLAHIFFAVVGISALIAASQTAFAVVKWLGVVYLIFLAGQMAFNRSKIAAEGKPSLVIVPLRAFRRAVMVNLLNPKVGIFFLAFLPQFIDPQAAAPAIQILALGLLFNTTGFIVNAAVGVASAHAATRFADNVSLGRAMRFVTAGILGALAVRLAITANE